MTSEDLLPEIGALLVSITVAAELGLAERVNASTDHIESTRVAIAAATLWQLSPWTDGDDTTMSMTIVRPVNTVSSTGPSDASLMARIAVGDDRALQMVYERYSPLVYGLARRVTASASHAEEITQEVFVYVWQNPDRFDAERGTLRAFLGALAHRRSVDEVRRNARRTAREDRVGGDATNMELLEIGDDIEQTQTAERVRAAVSSLPEQQREAVLLAYFGGCTFRQVGERLGIPEGTAKSRLRLGLGKLAVLLEGLT